MIEKYCQQLSNAVSTTEHREKANTNRAGDLPDPEVRSERTEWRDTLNVLDLAAHKPEWQSMRQPFKRRTLIAATFSGQMYVLGGFDEHGKILHEVSIYNPTIVVWTQGPPLAEP